MSTTYLANIVSILTLGLPAVGIHVVDPGTLTSTISLVIGAFAAFWVFVGRFRAGGIGIFGLRTK